MKSNSALTGLLVFLLGAAGLTLIYGVSKSSPDIITASLWISAFALLTQFVRTGMFVTNPATSKPAKVVEPVAVEPQAASEPVVEPEPEPEIVPEPEVVLPPASVPFANYDDDPPAKVIKRLATLPPSELDNAHLYEKQHAARPKVITRIEQLQRKAALRSQEV